jgi:hypothetical protein
MVCPACRVEPIEPGTAATSNKPRGCLIQGNTWRNSVSQNSCETSIGGGNRQLCPYRTNDPVSYNMLWSENSDVVDGRAELSVTATSGCHH